MASSTKGVVTSRSKAKSIIGKVFGRLLVVGVIPSSRQSRVVCKCECGAEKEVEVRFLLTSKNLHCGCSPVSKKLVSDEHKKAVQKRWREKNKAKLKADYSKWRMENWETLVEKKKQWRHLNTDKVAAARKKFVSAHPEKVQAGKNLYRARKMKAVVGNPALIAEWESAWKKKRRVRCYWCGGSFAPKDCHSDHLKALDLGGAHEVGNLVISCAACNLRKNSLTVEDWNSKIVEPVLL